MIYVGIDPGQKGGIAVIKLDAERHISAAHAFPYSNDKLKEVAYEVSHEYTDNVLCFVEKVGAMPKQGVTSMFNFGVSFGYILGVLEANDVPYQLVTPQKWKKHFGLDNDKSKSVALCKRLFPTISLLPTERCRKDSDGMAEALLIALYAKRSDNITELVIHGAEEEEPWNAEEEQTKQ